MPLHDHRRESQNEILCYGLYWILIIGNLFPTWFVQFWAASFDSMTGINLWQFVHSYMFLSPAIMIFASRGNCFESLYHVPKLFFMAPNDNRSCIIFDNAFSCSLSIFFDGMIALYS